MSKVLDQATSDSLRAWLSYGRELGVGDLYRREVPPELLEQLQTAPSAIAPGIAGSENSVGTMDVAAGAPSEIEETNPDVSAAKRKVNRNTALRVIREDLGECTRCPLHKQGRKQIVFGVGDVNARLMFVGEGPGADEDEQGEPFVGRAGQLLNNMINAMGLKREQVYIGNVVKCRPPQNRTPEREECETCSPFLMRQIAVVRPEIIVALGATASKALLAVNASMANLRGKFYDFHPAVDSSLPEHDAEFFCKLAVTYHPAYLLRDPRQKKETWKDLQMVMKYLGLPLPKATGGA